MADLGARSRPFPRGARRDPPRNILGPENVLDDSSRRRPRRGGRRERERESRRATAEREVEVMLVYYLKRANNYSNSKNKIRIANFETKICKPGLETTGNPNLCVLCVSGNTGNCSTVSVGAYLTRIFMPTAFRWVGIQQSSRMFFQPKIFRYFHLQECFF